MTPHDVGRKGSREEKDTTMSILANQGRKEESDVCDEERVCWKEGGEERKRDEEGAAGFLYATARAAAGPRAIAQATRR